MVNFDGFFAVFLLTLPKIFRYILKSMVVFIIPTVVGLITQCHLETG